MKLELKGNNINLVFEVDDDGRLCLLHCSAAEYKGKVER